jgi:hypothetical protein
MRTLDRVLAVVLALVGFAAGIALTVEIAHRALGGTGHLLIPYEPVAAFVRSNAWSSPAVLIIGAALALLGVVLLVAELKPRRPGLLVLESGHPDVTAALPRASIARVVEHATSDLPGVDHVRAKARDNKVTLTAHTPLARAGDLPAQVESAAARALTDLRLRRTPTVTVRMQEGA